MRKSLILFLALFLIGGLLFALPFQNAEALVVESNQFSSLLSDGYVLSATTTNYTQVHDQYSGTVFDSLDVFVVGQVFTTGTYTIYRTFLLFDTSSIPVGAAVTSAILSLNVSSIAGVSLIFNITIQDGQPTFPHNPIESGDYYFGHYSGNGGSRNTSSIGAAGYWNITLNSDGYDMITTGGTTKLCLRSGDDINSTAPIGNEALSVWSAEKGAAHSPRLYVTYFVGGTTYLVHGPYYEDGTVALTNVNVTVVQPFNTSLTFNLNGTDGTADTQNVTISQPADYMIWDWGDANNLTRFYAFLNVTFDEINLYVPDPANPYFSYTFTVADFFGMANPYLEPTINVAGQTQIVERKSLNTVNSVSFVMQQWSKYGLLFRADQGLYTQFFDAETTVSHNLQVLSGAFPDPSFDNSLFAYAQRISTTTIQITYSDPDLATAWVYYAIYHQEGSATVIDSTSNTTTNSLSTSWTDAEEATDYFVDIEALSGSTTYSWTFSTPAPITTTNPWADLFDSLGTWPPNFNAASIPAATLILFTLGIFSFAHVGLGCMLAWVVTGIMMLLGWYTLALPTFGFAGFVSVLAVLMESKKTEREL